jgi:hypothetical protein
MQDLITAPKVKPGDRVMVRGNECVYIGPKGVMAEVSFNGRSDLVAPGMMTPVTGAAATPEPPAGDDVLAGLIDQIDALHKKLQRGAHCAQERTGEARREGIAYAARRPGAAAWREGPDTARASLRGVRPPPCEQGPQGGLQMTCGRCRRRGIHCECYKARAWPYLLLLAAAVGYWLLAVNPD